MKIFSFFIHVGPDSMWHNLPPSSSKIESMFNYLTAMLLTTIFRLKYSYDFFFYNLWASFGDGMVLKKNLISPFIWVIN